MPDDSNGRQVPDPVGRTDRVTRVRVGDGGDDAVNADGHGSTAPSRPNHARGGDRTDYAAPSESYLNEIASRTR